MSASTVARLALAACLATIACGGAVVAQSSDAREGATAVFTNSDLERLPAPGNDRLPVLEAPAPVAATAATTPGTDAAASAAAPPAAAAPAPSATEPVDPATVEWLEQRIERLRFDQAIAEAKRRLDEATSKLTQLLGSHRPSGSAFPEDPGAVETMYVRGVADPRKPHDDALQRAYRDRAAAERDLDRLLALARSGEDARPSF